MLRKRDSSTINALERQNKIRATEYFAAVVEKMKTLLEAIEHTHMDPFLNTHSHTFDRDSRVIDFILVYDKTARRPAKEKVNQFLKILVREGFSTEGGESEIYEHLIFIRIHCHRSKLVKAGTVLDMNLGYLSEHMILDYSVFFNFGFLFNDLTRPLDNSDVAQRARDAAFNSKPKDITNAERILVTYELMKNTRYGTEDDELGVTSLLHKKFLATCFPLHDGSWEWTEDGPLNDRQILMKYWAHSSNWYKLQPLHLIKQYFGSEVAFYFAFLGYFNKMLIVPAFCGIISLVYGVLTYSDSRNYKTKAICASKILICPPCHDVSICHYERLDNECHTSQMAYILDNFATAIYSIFWCFWSTIIFAKWKRRQSVLLFRWNLSDMENEINIRPQFLGRAMSNKGARKTSETIDDVYLSVENQRREDTYLRVLRYCASGFVIILLILVVLLILYLAVIVRWWTGLIIGRFDGQFSFQWRILLVTTVGNLLVILFICIAEDLFVPLAHWITDFENPRTEEEYDQAYIYKYAVLCFITSYSFLGYTAFLKGRFFSYPSHEMQYIIFGILTYDLERIHTPMLSVSYQWTMITIGKEIWTHIMYSRRPWRSRKQKTRNFKNVQPRIWEEEYQLRSHDHPFLIEENMKVMLQYGYLVLFPGANPLGPLIFFLYNVWRLRNDAQRVLVRSRRVIPTRIAGFGPWMKLIKMITILGIGTNVFLLAFTSNVVPELCHWFNPYYTNYINFTFSAFAIDDYPDSFGAEIKRGLKGAICFYKGNRYPPSADNKYENNILHWNQLSVRFFTVILVQSFVIIFCSLILFTISDTPHFIRESIRHRANLKEREREEKFRREKMKRSTVNLDLRRNFTVIDY